MPLRIELQDSTGRAIAKTGETYSTVPEALPLEATRDYPALGRVDREGDTLFEREDSVRELLGDLERLSERELTHPQRRIVIDLIGFAERCLVDPELRIKFIGD